MAEWSEVTVGLPDHRPREDHWYLAVLGVDPAWQGQGWGGRLLDAVFDVVERDPRPLCLECDRPESVRFYEARGFRVRAEGEVHGVPCWCLGYGFESDSV